VKLGGGAQQTASRQLARHDNRAYQELEQTTGIATFLLDSTACFHSNGRLFQEVPKMKPDRVVLLVLLAAVPVMAHHGGAGYEEKTQVLVGTVKQFQFTNPHSWIQVDVKDAAGKVVEWSLEWGSPNSLSRDGVHPSTFPVGAKATFEVHPAKNGVKAGLFEGAKFEDGTTVGKWDTPAGNY
jgi:Family of unknown function (DUF6152)